MEEKIIDKSFIAFLDDDNRKREDWVKIIEKNNSYISFKYQRKIVTIPWHRILKLKENNDD